MCIRSLILLLALSTGSVAVIAQPSAGTVVVKGAQVKGKDKRRALDRKRFYLFEGGLAANQPLIDRIRTAQITSRDCYYVGLKASPCLLAWLREENCETPFCRVVKREDIAGVPEFQAAYDKGVTLYNRKPDIALSWLLNNMSASLVSGYYRQQKGLVATILGDLKPVQSTMATSTAAEANFVGVSAGEKPTKYLISNILPVEIDDKSLVWACEVDVSRNKIATVALQLIVDPKRKNCVQIVNELKACAVETCNKK